MSPPSELRADRRGLLAAFRLLAGPARGSEKPSGGDLGPYARIRHPQYAAFVLMMLGFLLQWPTLLTALMFPLLAWMYGCLARREEREVLAEFGDEYARYAAATPRFLPKWRAPQTGKGSCHE